MPMGKNLKDIAEVSAAVSCGPLQYATLRMWKNTGGAGRSLKLVSGELEGVFAVEGGAGPSQPSRREATEALLGGLAWGSTSRG
jgi:hypothetical protein